MLNFFNRNAGAIQALSAALTVVLALVALLGVKFQIDASERIQRTQSARDIYREFLNLSISRPEFAKPNYCAISGTAQEPAYETYVEYLLYTADQTIAVDPTWETVFFSTLRDHTQYVCTLEDLSDYSEDVQNLINRFHTKHCADIQPCG